jgi:hypothetical protein
MAYTSARSALHSVFLINDGKTRSFTFEHSIYSGRELKDRLLSCGFREVRLFGDLPGPPYSLDAASPSLSLANHELAFFKKGLIAQFATAEFHQSGYNM